MSDRTVALEAVPADANRVPDFRTDREFDSLLLFNGLRPASVIGLRWRRTDRTNLRGLCPHFAAALRPHSIHKAWVVCDFTKAALQSRA